MKSPDCRRSTVLLATAAFLLLATGCASSSGPVQRAGDSGTLRTAIIRTVRALIPAGSLTQNPGISPAHSGPMSAVSFTLTRNSAVGDLRISVSRLPSPVSPQFSSCPDSALNPYSNCAIRKRRGAVLLSDEQPVDGARPSAGQRLTAVLTTTDGRQLVLSEATVAAGAGTATTRARADLPLTLRQLTVMADSKKWRPVLASLPDVPAPAAPSVDQSLPADKITAIIERSLPSGLDVAHAGGQPGFGHVTVDDGLGTCLVAVTVQHWKPEDADIAALFAKARRTSDGTRVLTSRTPSAKGGSGAVEWRVDTLSRSGVRVLVSEVNARAYHLPGTRTTPVLDIDRLTRIARDGAWQEASRSPSLAR
ncbi:hypothetical protein ABZT06_48415 [Streptomyces sp. NPDC005483]|uniref:hypothetical protein n=1 Tax=Streptomyces sp. NPDC005483 TaxID=3154882 RepID=UPI0033B3E037